MLPPIPESEKTVDGYGKFKKVSLEEKMKKVAPLLANKGGRPVGSKNKQLAQTTTNFKKLFVAYMNDKTRYKTLMNLCYERASKSDKVLIFMLEQLQGKAQQSLDLSPGQGAMGIIYLPKKDVPSYEPIDSENSVAPTTETSGSSSSN